MEKKIEKFSTRSQQVVNFLRNPYNMIPSPQKNQMESLFPFQSPRIQQKTLTRKLFSFNSHRTTFPALNSSNNFYLKKNNKSYKKDREEWEGQLQLCLQSKSLLPHKSVRKFESSSNNSTLTLIKKKSPRVIEQNLEIQAYKLL